MSRFAVARINAAAHVNAPEFFCGEYMRNERGLPVPVRTTAAGDAHVYPNRMLAGLAVDVFNVFEGAAAGEPVRNWMVVELPEQWS